MKLTKSDAWHISKIMEERGVGHCAECRKILQKLREMQIDQKE